MHKSYPPPCRNYIQPLYLSVTLYACAQRDEVTDNAWGVTITCGNTMFQIDYDYIRVLQQTVRHLR